ncbi:hypothetical protein [Halomarina ordinaria]|uniref:Uncharacterized protein n=1 Tax=Halomarina ordinaria TaxID=3033939 RepID=A0ABD5U9M4_9EURY|nr:hypothetical protein [Halomarina sp. PSRA2]
MSQESTQTEPSVTALVERARDDLADLVSLALGDGAVEDAVDAVDDLLAVAREAEELLETVDVDDAAASAEPSELPEVIDVGELATGDLDDGVALSRLHRLVDLGELWSSVDVREFWRNKQELEAALAEVGLVDEESEDEGDDGGGFGLDTGDVGFGGGDGGGSDGDGDDDRIPVEAIQAGVQQQLAESLSEFREVALDARDELEAATEKAQERMPEHQQSSSRNPTAVSLVPSARRDAGLAGRASTVPRETRHSEAPNTERLVGRRLRQRSEDEGEDDG